MKVKAVIFDLDGTLTRPILDFDRIRAEIGEIDGPILEAIDRMSEGQAERARAVLHRHEEVAAEESELNAGAGEVLAELRGRGRKIGLLTRNQRRSVERVCEIHGLKFDAIVTREDGPAKPDPFGVEQLCKVMNVEPGETVMVGDYVFDLMSGRAAGAVSVLLITHDRSVEFAEHADYVIEGLGELAGVIDTLEGASGSRDAGIGAG